MLNLKWPVRAQALALKAGELVEAAVGHVEDRVELGARERAPFAGALDFDHAAVSQPDDVQIDFGRRVFAVVEIEHDLARDDAWRSRRRCCRAGPCGRFPHPAGCGVRRRRR